jgi:hypothetical protein
MGYRSNVAYLILFPSDEEYHSFLSEVSALSGQRIQGEEFDHINGNSHWGDMRSALAETVHGVGIYNQRYLSIDGDYLKFPAIAFKAEEVKWYPSYPEVHAHESLLFLARQRIDMENKTSYRVGKGSDALMTKCAVNYLRIGEDHGDVEQVEEGSHISVFVSPIWVKRSVNLCEAMEKLFDKEDV